MERHPERTREFVMRHLLRLLLAGGLLTGPLVNPALAVSAEDLVNLKINGLSDDVLVALIESDGSSFRLSAADIIALYKRGLSERVILAMVNTGKRAAGPIVQPVSNVPDVQSSDTRNQDVTITGASPASIHVEQSVVQRVENSQPPEPIVVSVPVAIPVPVLP